MKPEPMRKNELVGALMAILLSLGIIAAGVGAMGYLIKTKKKPTTRPDAAVAPMVETITVHSQTRPVTLRLQGQVMPARQLMLLPEVGARIVWHDDELVPGGIVKKGQVLVRLNPRDYQLAVSQTHAQVATQELTLQMERSRGKIAQKEWQLFQEGNDATPDVPDPDSLALRGPQMRSAQVALQAARSNLSKAQLMLSRTTLTAPFDAVVQAESVELGALVGPQTPLVTLVGTDAFWVQISLPIDKLRFLDLPSGDQPGSSAEVWVDAGDGRISRRGTVVRLLGDLDPVGRMARVLVEVPDPLGLVAQHGNAASASNEAVGLPQSGLPLLLGSFANVAVSGKTLDNVIELPRRALQPGDLVYVLDDKDQLEIRKAIVLWSSVETVLVRGGLRDEDRVVVSPIAAPVVGMKLRAGAATVTSQKDAPKQETVQ